MAAVYKLRCNVVGHTKDVRAVAATIFPDSGIVSGSRDVSARIWTPTEEDNGFVESLCLRGHSNYVSAVCVTPPDNDHPDGLVFTASNDSTILAFSPSSSEPLYKLCGHTNCVCALASGKFGTLVSGSWDKTARVWLREKCVMTLEGHDAAVWAVAVIPEHGLMLSASADKTIKMWSAGKLQLTFTGHTDCVRGLAVLSSSEFLSCSNDASIRRWHMSGGCLETYFGHCNYIYSVSVLPNGRDFVSCGEDRTLRVWRGGECVQTLAHPTESVWSVCCLQNGDIVTGASDGVIRVFTCDPSRMANQTEQEALEDLVSASTIPTQIGDIDMKELPGPEALTMPGNRDGQSKMVREGKLVMLYHWDSSAARWVKMGEIIGSTAGSQATSGKKLYEGQEYDYVFDVDIEEGQPPLKLPYNTSDDPWHAAQNFLHKNDLSQLFLDQVANFIQTNAKGVTLGEHASTYSDPFTGASSYKSSDAGSLSHPENKYFPQNEYLSFANANQTNIIGKLKEFNEQVEASVRLNDDMIGRVPDLMDGRGVTQEHLDILSRLFQWTSDKLLPVLDIIRLAVRHERVNQHVSQLGRPFIERAAHHITADQHQPNQLLALRILANLFHRPSGADVAVANYDIVSPTLIVATTTANKHIQIAASSVLLNYCVSLRSHGRRNDDVKLSCLNVAAKCLANKDLDSEATFRLLVCIGTLLHNDPMVMAAAQSLGIKEDIRPLSELIEPAKLPDCAKIIAALL